MKHLFNSNGQHIANEIDGRIYATTGQNIGHLLPTGEFYIDMQGYYLGEIVFENRFLYRTNNGFENTSYGIYGNFRNIGSYNNLRSIKPIGKISGYGDVDNTKLR